MKFWKILMESVSAKLDNIKRKCVSYYERIKADIYIYIK